MCGGGVWHKALVGGGGGQLCALLCPAERGLSGVDHVLSCSSLTDEEIDTQPLFCVRCCCQLCVRVIILWFLFMCCFVL